MGISDTTFIKACYGKNDGRIPIWIMRQAGRYLPEYRAVREQASFVEMCRSPELITKVVRQPIERFGFDAAILFSDILTMLTPMGMEFEFPDGGPRVSNPIGNPHDIDGLHDMDPTAELGFVLDGIRQIKSELPDTPLIGFTGSPFTLACYMIEGMGSKSFDRARRFLHEYPKAAERLFDLLADNIARYLNAQIEAGAEAVQLFESWGGILSREDYRRWSAAPIQRIFGRLKSEGVPRILFVNNVAPYLDIVRDIDCEVIGVDFRADLAAAAAALPGKSVQGNLDPSFLFGSREQLVAEATRILDSMDDLDRLIFNLGHGIQPQTPLEAVEAVVATVHNYRGCQ
jgi:uroporphyrinogen decarboxylase